MLETWNTFLQTQGAKLSDGVVTDFGDAAAERRAARDANILVDLSPLSLIRVSGPDANAFLNAQLTNDVTRLVDNTALLAGWCTPKGRLLTLMRVIRHGNDYLLQLPAVLRDDILKRLRIFVLRSKVTLEAVDNRWVQLGISGPDAPRLVQAMSANGALVLSVAGTLPRFMVLIEPSQAPSLWQAATQTAKPAGWGNWLWLDILAGAPIVLPATSEAFVPQMANLDLINGVSFTKGCYPGQEIVARVHYRGRLKERMFRAHADIAKPPRPGDAIYAPDMPGQATGTVVSAQPSPDGGVDLLAVIHLSSAQAGELHLGGPDGPRLALKPLPYTVDGSN